MKDRKKTLKNVISNAEHSHSWREMGLIRPILMELYLTINLHSCVNVNNRAFSCIILFFLQKEYNIYKYNAVVMTVIKSL